MANLAPQDDVGRQLSVMFQHRIGLRRVVSVGLNRGSEHPADVSSRELFAKVALEY